MASGFVSRVAARVLSTLIDPTIVLSFDRTGYRIHQLGFRDDDLDVDMTGRVCVVTGANSGLGYAAALALARRGADVWLLCRNRQRGAAALKTIKRTTRNAHVHLAVVDMASRRAIRAFAARFAAERVDVLVNNAGVLPDQRSETEDGIELTWATNVVGPFLLTSLLVPRLVAAPHGRIITVSSGGMYTQKLVLDDPQSRTPPFDGVKAYALTKRAEVVLSELWAERLRHTRVTANSMHPGWADTPSVRASLPRFYRVMRSRLRTPAEGADTIVWLAVCQHLAGRTGLFWFDRRPCSTHYLPWTREAPRDRERLWTLCCKLAEVPDSGQPSAISSQPNTRR
jgi:NAD(P)-dependent dehydrogenase (short-subunit alcohol dehydrogenase family)